MNKSQIIEKNIRDIFHESKSLDLGFLDILADMNFPMLLQVIRHRAETVYIYRINAVPGIGRPYYGPELFPVRATQLYYNITPFSERDIHISRVAEIWLLEDGSLAAVANMQTIVESGLVISEYRTVKTTDLAEICRDVPIDRTRLARYLQNLCQLYENDHHPCYE